MSNFWKLYLINYILKGRWFEKRVKIAFLLKWATYNRNQLIIILTYLWKWESGTADDGIEMKNNSKTTSNWVKFWQIGLWRYTKSCRAISNRFALKFDSQANYMRLSITKKSCIFPIENGRSASIFFEGLFKNSLWVDSVTDSLNMPIKLFLPSLPQK